MKYYFFVSKWIIYFHRCTSDMSSMLPAVIVHLLFCLEPISLLSAILFVRVSTLWDPVLVWTSTMSVDRNWTCKDIRGEETPSIVPTSKDKKCKHFYVVVRIGRVHKNTLYIIWLTNKLRKKIWFWSITLRLTRQKCFFKKIQVGSLLAIKSHLMGGNRWLPLMCRMFVCICAGNILHYYFCLLHTVQWLDQKLISMIMPAWACQWLYLYLSSLYLCRGLLLLV
jgi:hypothetical protein